MIYSNQKMLNDEREREREREREVSAIWMQRFIDRFMFCVTTNSQEEIDEPLPPETSSPPYQPPNKHTATTNNI